MIHKILLADRHPIVHEGIRRVFAEEPNFEIVAHTADLAGVPHLVERFEPDLVITEARFEDQDAIKVFESILLERNTMVVIVFSQHNDSFHIARAGAVGCYEYLIKTGECSDLLVTAKNGVNGIASDPSGLLSRSRSRIKTKRASTDPDSPLTQREMQVIRHVAMGLKNREIGLSLKISVETVKEHVQNILRKLGVNDRTQAAVTAVKREWI